MVLADDITRALCNNADIQAHLITAGPVPCSTCLIAEEVTEGAPEPCHVVSGAEVSAMAAAGGPHHSHPSAVEHLSGMLRERQKALLGGLELGELLGRGSFGKVYKGARDPSAAAISFPHLRVYHRADRSCCAQENEHCPRSAQICTGL